MLIFGLDALDVELVEKFGCKNLKQVSYGATDITNFQEPKTAILWASFLTGRNMEEEIPSDCLWTFQVPPEDSFVSHFRNPIMLDFPSFSYRLADHQREKDLLKKYFVDDGGPEVIDEYERVVWEIHGETKKQLWLKVRSGSDLIGAYFNLVDSIGHLSFGIEAKMREAYQKLDQLVAEAKQIRPDEDCLIVSDHGMKPVGRYGDHTMHGFWSFSSSLDLSNPSITAFRSFIEG